MVCGWIAEDNEMDSLVIDVNIGFAVSGVGQTHDLLYMGMPPIR